VHLFEWQTAALAALLRDSDLPPVLFTVADPSRQGVAAAKELKALGVAEADMAAAVSGGRCDLVSLGVANADVCAVASPTYADELKKAGGPGGDASAAFEANGFKLVGITPGVDYAVWNPATDPALASRYAAEEAEAKGSCKTALVRALGLELDTTRPLFSMVGDLDRPSGADIVVAALARLLKQGSSVVFAGTVQGALRAKIETAAEKASGLCAFLDEPDQGTVHRVLSATDMLLIPARRAPLPHLAQIALRYGAAPVCHEVDTLGDAVVDCDSSLGTGTGFLFEELSARDLLAASARAVAGYGSGSWSELVRRMMRQDVGWDRPARRYAQIYRQLSRGVVPTAE
jgi:starch synthase